MEHLLSLTRRRPCLRNASLLCDLGQAFNSVVLFVVAACITIAHVIADVGLSGQTASANTLAFSGGLRVTRKSKGCPRSGGRLAHNHANNIRQNIVPLLQRRPLRLPERCTIVDGGDPLLLVCKIELQQQAARHRRRGVELRTFGAGRATSSGGIVTPVLASLASNTVLPLLQPENPVPRRPKTLPSAPSGLSGSAAAIAGSNGTSWAEPAFIRSAPISRRSVKLHPNASRRSLRDGSPSECKDGQYERKSPFPCPCRPDRTQARHRSTYARVPFPGAGA